MKHLGRAIRLTFKYKVNIAIILFSALGLAFCWGANISAVYPLIQINFQGRTASDYWNDQIKNARLRLNVLKTESPSNVALIQKTEWKLRGLEKFQPFIERYAPKTPYRTVVALMIFLTTATLFKAFFQAVHSYFSARIRNLGVFELRELFFRRAIEFDVDYFNRKGVSDTTSRFTNDMNSLAGGLTIFYGQLIREPLKMIVCLTGAALISWRLLIFSILFIPLVATIVRFLSRKLKKVVRDSMAETVNLYRRVGETFRSIRIVKIFNQERRERAKFRRTNREQFKRSMKIAKYSSLVAPVNDVFLTAVLVATILIGSYLVLLQETQIFGVSLCSEPLTLGGVILFYGFLTGAVNPAKRLSENFLFLQDSAAAAERVFEMIDRKNLVVEPSRPERIKAFSKNIRFENVSFSYEVESQKMAELDGESKSSLKRFEQATASNQPRSPRMVLKNISLEIAFGETIAIIGPSGCGKSSLLNLIPRFADPTSGDVSIDGVSLRNVKIFDLRRQIGLITQSPILFNGTVRENIEYGTYGASFDQIVDAAKRAFAHDFIMNDLSDRYETNVGANGILLSGGQRQRISIARAILKNPKILLLDEATSQIDIQSEQMFHRALKDLLGDRTVIIVTHRTGALALADRIVVMNDGEIQAVGTHRELLETNAYYARLFSNSF